MGSLLTFLTFTITAYFTMTSFFVGVDLRSTCLWCISRQLVLHKKNWHQPYSEHFKCLHQLTLFSCNLLSTLFVLYNSTFYYFPVFSHLHCLTLVHYFCLENLSSSSTFVNISLYFLLSPVSSSLSSYTSFIVI